LPTEIEPNDVADSTHRFARHIFGCISMSDDVDYFYLADTSVHSLWLRSYDAGTKCGFVLIDSLQRQLAGTDVNERTEHLSVADSLRAPLFIRVYSIAGNGRYELSADTLR
jgi:hypothetical protein